jgi:hypothetical protein
VSARLAEGGGAAFEAEGDLIGLVLWAERDQALYLGRLAVRPRWRGHGAAQFCSRRPRPRRAVAACHACASTCVSR